MIIVGEKINGSIPSVAEVISSVRKQYPDIHIIAAVSNISFNLPVRKMVNLGFTVLAMNAGLDSAILDPQNIKIMVGGALISQAFADEIGADGL